jgi:hypothetical protein
MSAVTGSGSLVRTKRGPMPSKKAFDLNVAVILGVMAAFILPRLWATKRIMTGPPSGVGYTTAKVVKSITA